MASQWPKPGARSNDVRPTFQVPDVRCASVVRQPRVRLVITGNELLPSGSRPRDYQITDANGPMLAALAERDGAIVDFPGLVRDEPDAILAALHASAVRLLRTPPPA